MDPQTHRHVPAQAHLTCMPSDTMVPTQRSALSPSTGVHAECSLPSEHGVAAAHALPAARRVFISWAPHCSRSDGIAVAMGARSYMVYSRRFGSHPATVLFKYLWQAWKTVRLLRQERAEVAFVMTPPVFAGVTLLLYSLVFPLRYVVDVHTAALKMPRWQRLQWLQALVCRHAATTLVTNAHLGGIVEAWGGHTTQVQDVPVRYPINPKLPTASRFTVAVICSFNYDEPLDEVLAAAALLPQVDMVITGDHTRAHPELMSTAPANVRFAGFLSNADYGSLLAQSGVVMSLTTRDHTMLRGAYEGIYAGRPVVVSDWPLLRDAFDRGAVHVDNRAASIAQGIAHIQGEHARFVAEAGQLREAKLSRWRGVQAAIEQRLTAGPG